MQEGLRFGGDAGTIEIGSATGALHKAVGVHLRARGGSHFSSGGAIGCRQPAVGHTLIDSESQHLCEVGFDECVGLIDDVMEKTVGALMRETPIDDLAGEVRETGAIGVPV